MPAIRIDSILDVYQMKIKLEGAPKPIWRRILIPAAMSLLDLHCVLAYAFDWPANYVFQFRVQDKRYSLPELNVEKLLGGPDPLHAGKARLYTIVCDVGATLTWDYNFNEAWTSRLTVEKIRPIKAGDVLPWVLGGNMAAPPIGCGGMLSYRDLVEAIVDPEHEQRAYWMAWTKGSFDPKAFNLSETNERLHYIQHEFEDGYHA